jgi:hypothetical protein
MHRYMFLVLALALPSTGQDQPADLRSAAGCGPSQTQFDVKTDKHQHAVMHPEPGKALVYVIVEERRDPHEQQIGDITTRVGLDGNWAGANHGQSYISIAADPGAHRLCTDWQSRLKAEQKLSAAADLVAEAGKTYYYRAEVTIPWADHAANLRLDTVDGAEGLLLVSKSASSTWKIKN